MRRAILLALFVCAAASGSAAANDVCNVFGRVPCRSVVQPPVAVARVIPHYPADARRLRFQGVVSVRVRVSESGQVLSAQVVDGPPVLSFVSESAARQWKFRPGSVRGRNAPSEMVIKFRYFLSEAAPYAELFGGG